MVTIVRLRALGGYAAGRSIVRDVVGDCIYTADQAKRVKYAYDKGHQVASHTWAHKNLTTLNWDQSELAFVQARLSSKQCSILVHHEMWLAEEAIWKITGAYPAFVRPRKSPFPHRIPIGGY